MSRNSNERFVRKQFISIKKTNHNFLLKCACVAFNKVFSAKMKSVQKGLAHFLCSVINEEGFTNGN